MSEELFDIVTFGILQAGKDRDMVLHNMATLFKTDANKLTPYFTGDRKVIKGNINAAMAEKYRAVLENVGLVIKVEPSQQTADNLATNQAHAEDTSINTDGLSIAPVGADVIEKPTKVTAQKIDDISFITMAAPGADIIDNPVEVSVKVIADISDITLAEAGTDLLEHYAESIQLEVENIPGISLAEAGADIIVNPKPVEKAYIPDFSELSLCSENS